MSNVCTHRGNILVDSPCNLKSGIVCKYHGRRFDTCGNFKFMPKCEDVINFPSKKDKYKKKLINKKMLSKKEIDWLITCNIH